MKKILSILFLSIFILFSSIKIASAFLGFPENKEYVVVVTGTSGLPFTFGYSLSQANGGSKAENINGKVPSTFKFKGSILSIMVNKDTERGKINVKMYKDKKFMDSATTVNPYGSVQLCY
ncbi:MAG: hypothetical protein WCG23_04625 [bacterium]